MFNTLVFSKTTIFKDTNVTEHPPHKLIQMIALFSTTATHKFKDHAPMFVFLYNHNNFFFNCVQKSKDFAQMFFQLVVICFSKIATHKSKELAQCLLFYFIFNIFRCLNVCLFYFSQLDAYFWLDYLFSLQTCPPGLFYDPVLGICNWPEAVPSCSA